MKRARRTFSIEFKRRVVEEFLDRRVSQAQLCRRYGRALCAKDRLVSVYDQDMRHGRKSKAIRHDGHKGVLALDIDSQLITSVDMVAGNTHDGDTVLPANTHSPAGLLAHVR